MGQIRVVTDSCAGLPVDLVAAEQITVVPLTVRFGDESFLDGVEITTEEFYCRLARSPVLPKTSQPPVGEFLKVFRQLGEHPATDGILVVTISHKLSGTYAAARQAAAEFKGMPVEIVDSLSASLAQAFAARAAARAARAGATLAEAADGVRQMIRKCRLYGALDTLEYLHRGGRIGKAAAWVGGLLQLKPVVTIQDGEVVPVTRMRTRGKAWQFMLERLKNEMNRPGAPLHIGLAHSVTPEEAASLAEEVERTLNPDELIVTGFTPVLGTYTGPGTIALFSYQE